MRTLSVLGVAETPDIDWNRIHEETFEHYTNLIRIDASNPPGNEKGGGIPALGPRPGEHPVAGVRDEAGKRTGVPPDREVVFVAESGEEGTSDVGIDFLVREHWNDIAAEFALAEGGAGAARSGQYSILRTSVVPTVINVDFRSNLIPSEGEPRSTSARSPMKT